MKHGFRQAEIERRQATRRVFQRWLPDALEDLESLIALGKLEMGERERSVDE